MKRAEDVERVFKQAGLGIDPDADERVFADMLHARRQTTPNPKIVFDRGRIIMKSPFMKVAVAAAVVVTCLIGVSLWKRTGSGLALADVLARMEEVQTYRLRLSTAWQAAGMESKPTAEATILVSRTLGQKTTVHVSHPITGQGMLEEIYVPAHGRAVITLMPTERQYSKVELDDATMEQWERENDPRYLVERVTRCAHTRLGHSVIEGIEVEGFQTTDPNSWGGMAVPGAEIRIWAAVKTRLPVRIEAGKGEPGKGRLQVVAHDFEWNVPAEASDFTPVIPDDYTPGRPMMQLGPKK
jgi:hypothetical protein